MSDFNRSSRAFDLQKQRRRRKTTDQLCQQWIQECGYSSLVSDLSTDSVIVVPRNWLWFPSPIPLAGGPTANYTTFCYQGRPFAATTLFRLAYLDVDNGDLPSWSIYLQSSQDKHSFYARQLCSAAVPTRVPGRGNQKNIGFPFGKRKTGQQRNNLRHHRLMNIGSPELLPRLLIHIECVGGGGGGRRGDAWKIREFRSSIKILLRHGNCRWWFRVWILIRHVTQLEDNCGF